jgi:hypothetical protein
LFSLFSWHSSVHEFKICIGELFEDMLRIFGLILRRFFRFEVVASVSAVHVVMAVCVGLVWFGWSIEHLLRCIVVVRGR